MPVGRQNRLPRVSAVGREHEPLFVDVIACASRLNAVRVGKATGGLTAERGYKSWPEKTPKSQRGAGAAIESWTSIDPMRHVGGARGVDVGCQAKPRVRTGAVIPAMPLRQPGLSGVVRRTAGMHSGSHAQLHQEHRRSAFHLFRRQHAPADSGRNSTEGLVALDSTTWIQLDRFSSHRRDNVGVVCFFGAHAQGMREVQGARGDGVAELDFIARWSSLVAREAHNLQVAGSNPALATHPRPIAKTGRSGAARGPAAGAAEAVVDAHSTWANEAEERENTPVAVGAADPAHDERRSTRPKLSVKARTAPGTPGGSTSSSGESRSRDGRRECRKPHPIVEMADRARRPSCSRVTSLERTKPWEGVGPAAFSIGGGAC